MYSSNLIYHFFYTVWHLCSSIACCVEEHVCSMQIYIRQISQCWDLSVITRMTGGMDTASWYNPNRLSCLMNLYLVPCSKRSHKSCLSLFNRKWKSVKVSGYESFPHCGNICLVEKLGCITLIYVCSFQCRSGYWPGVSVYSQDDKLPIYEILLFA